MKTKKSQLTLFIILGIVVLLLALGLLYYSNTMKKSDIRQKTLSTQNSPLDLQPLVSYVENFIELSAKEGIFLLGSQGGAIYTSQGGNIMDYEDSAKGVLFVEYGSRKVPYLIGKSGGGGSCISSLPEYPLRYNKYYPYGTDRKFGDEDRGYVQVNKCFGKAYLFSMDSMLDGLEKYLRNSIETKLSFDLFKNYDIEQSEAEINIENTPSSTNIVVSYPLDITDSATGGKTSLKEFRYSLPLSLHSLRQFTSEIIELDIGDPRYNIQQGIQNSAFNVYVHKDVYKKDDVVEISSDSLILDGQPFRFIFARRNRPPALEYVYDTSFNSTPLIEHGKIIWNEVIHQDLSAVDPDEDDVTIGVKVEANTLIPQSITETQPYEIKYGDVVEQKLQINITASDGEYIDYQAGGHNDTFVLKMP